MSRDHESASSPLITMAKQVEFLSGDDMDAILALVDEDIIKKEADFGAVFITGEKLVSFYFMIDIISIGISLPRGPKQGDLTFLCT